MTENRVMTDQGRLLAEWRIDNLYCFDSWQENKVIRFKRNEYQLEMWHSLLMDGTVKRDDRCKGFSMLLAVLMVDTCVFHNNISCSIVDLMLRDARNKLARVLEIYNNLPKHIKDENPIISSSADKIEWKNGSMITAGTTPKGSSLDILHIFGFRKMLSRVPKLASDIEKSASSILKPDGWIAWEAGYPVA